MLGADRLAAAIGCTFALAIAAAAADFSDPTWPCIQRKVEHLSIALMWPYPLSKTAPDAALRAGIDDLAAVLALRRIEVEAIRPEVDAFVAAHSADPGLLGQVFEKVFDTLDARRFRIIGGIADFSQSQIALAARIDATRLDMDRLMKAEEPDFDRVDELEETLDWDQVIYTDRQRSITYLCETPKLIEQRLFAVAQLLAGYIENPG